MKNFTLAHLTDVAKRYGFSWRWGGDQGEDILLQRNGATAARGSREVVMSYIDGWQDALSRSPQKTVVVRHHVRSRRPRACPECSGTGLVSSGFKPDDPCSRGCPKNK